MKILSNRVALASWLLLLQATGIHASCFPLKNFRSLKTKKQQKITPLLRKSQRHIKSLWTLNRGLFTLKRFNLTTILKFIKKEIERIYDLHWKGKKIRTPRHVAQLSLWRGGLGILDRYSIKLSKNKTYSKIVKSHKCSLETSHAVPIELDSEFLSRTSPF